MVLTYSNGEWSCAIAMTYEGTDGTEWWPNLIAISNIL